MLALSENPHSGNLLYSTKYAPGAGQLSISILTYIVAATRSVLYGDDYIGVEEEEGSPREEILLDTSS